MSKYKQADLLAAIQAYRNAIKAWEEGKGYKGLGCIWDFIETSNDNFKKSPYYIEIQKNAQNIPANINAKAMARGIYNIVKDLK